MKAIILVGITAIVVGSVAYLFGQYTASTAIKADPVRYQKIHQGMTWNDVTGAIGKPNRCSLAGKLNEQITTYCDYNGVGVIFEKRINNQNGGQVVGAFEL